MVPRDLRSRGRRAAVGVRFALLAAALLALGCSGLVRGGPKDVSGGDAASRDGAGDLGPDAVTCETGCDDGDPCTADRCDEGTGQCLHGPDAGAEGAPCDDGDVCTLTSVCASGVCVGTLSIDCNDREPCTDDACDPVTGCTFTPHTRDCTPANQDCVTGRCEAGICELTARPPADECLLGGGCVPARSRPPDGAHADCLVCDPDRSLTTLSPDTGLLGQTCDSNPCRIGPVGQTLFCQDDGTCGGPLSNPTNEGASCEFGRPDLSEGVCQGGDCRPLCGETVCPALGDYEVFCTERGSCAYHRPGGSGAARWDEWIWVPPGTFRMGGAPGEPGGDPAEGPEHDVTFAQGFFVARWPVVVEAYEACVLAGACAPASAADDDAEGWGANTSANGRIDHPQNGLHRDQAQAFCAWWVEGDGGRLPSEAEWEYAASGPTHRIWPWGDTPAPACDRAIFDHLGEDGERPWACEACAARGCSGTAAVDDTPDGASAFGVEAMAGQVQEWTADCWHDNYDDAPTNGAPWTTACASSDGVTRGGSFASPPNGIRTATRVATSPSLRSARVGARCVR